MIIITTMYCANNISIGVLLLLLGLPHPWNSQGRFRGWWRSSWSQSELKQLHPGGRGALFQHGLALRYPAKLHSFCWWVHLQTLTSDSKLASNIFKYLKLSLTKVDPVWEESMPASSWPPKILAMGHDFGGFPGHPVAPSRKTSREITRGVLFYFHGMIFDWGKTSMTPVFDDRNWSKEMFDDRKTLTWGFFNSQCLMLSA